MNDLVKVVVESVTSSHDRLVDVVLRRGNEYVSCTGMLIWDDEAMESTFEEWKDIASNDEMSEDSGCLHWVR